MYFKKTIAALLLSVSATFSWAAPTWYWSFDVGFVTSDISGNVQVIFIKDGVHYTPCAGIDTYTFQYGGNNSAADKSKDVMTSSLMTAYAAKRKVSAVIDCDTNYIHAVRLDRE